MKVGKLPKLVRLDGTIVQTSMIMRAMRTDLAIVDGPNGADDCEAFRCDVKTVPGIAIEIERGAVAQPKLIEIARKEIAGGIVQ